VIVDTVHSVVVVVAVVLVALWPSPHLPAKYVQKMSSAEKTSRMHERQPASRSKKPTNFSKESNLVHFANTF